MTVLLAITAVTVLVTSPTQSANFVPGEVMVKFVAGSEAAMRVREISQQTPLRLEALEPVVKQLEARTELPLTVTQLTSGDWVVLKIDAEHLSRDVADRLRGYQNVAQAEVIGEERQYIGYSAPKKIAVAFVPDTMEARTVSETLTEKGGSNLGNLVSRLQQRAASPLKAEVTEQEGLLLQVDLKPLTLTLQDRLHSLPFIESTQLNHVMTAF
jgi:hypothetical protein